MLDHAGGADHVLVADDDDAEALALARAARAAAPDAQITVLMRDVRLAEDAARDAERSRAPGCSPPPPSPPARSTIAHPPFLIAKERGHARIHALIVGFGQTGQAIARDLIVNCRTTYLGPAAHHRDRPAGQGAGGRAAGAGAGDRRTAPSTCSSTARSAAGRCGRTRP